VSSGWTGFPDAVTNQAEISNDTGTYKTLMIVGNRSAGVGRRVSVWDRLEVNGSAFKPGGGSWSSISDVRVKKSVMPLKGALEKLSRLRGVSFEWKNPEEQGNLTGTQIGLVAQEVEEVFPEWISTDPNGYKNLTIRGFEALTVEAFRELKAENEMLTMKNEELEDRIKVLELTISGRQPSGNRNGAVR
jgi:Chaperone of endosialidase